MKLFFENKDRVRLTYPKKLDFPLHLHEALEVVFLFRGESCVITGNKKIPLREGEIFCSFPNQVHGYENTTDFEGVVLIIPPSFIHAEKRRLLETMHPVSSVFRPTPEQKEYLDAILSLAIQDMKTDDQPLLSGYGQILVSKLLSWMPLAERPLETDALRRVLQYVSVHFAEPVTRSSIAKAMGYSESYLSHLFSEGVGMRLMEYVTLLRVNASCRYLTETNLSVGEIAMELGFSSHRALDRFFLRIKGVTPTAFREKSRKKAETLAFS